MVALADPVTGPGASAGASGEAAVRASVDLPPDPLQKAASTPLPEARQEVVDIAPVTAIVRTGAAARASFLAGPEVARAAVIHLATHALSDPVDGRRSAVLLAPEAGAPPPAVVRAAAIETLSLKADLVVLSACRSGIGHAVLGEGSFGLPRSLLVAGCRSVVASLWDVEDAATRRFMGRFYRELAAGRPRDTALRLAGRALAREGAPYRDWAGFFLTGVGHEPVPALVRHSAVADLRHSAWLLVLVLAAAGSALYVFARRRSRRASGG
jgi:CHAT domain-containing protein